MRHLTILLASSVALLPMIAHAEAAETAVLDTDTIVVVGKGETRQAQTITAKDLAAVAPGTSPLKAIENLPSVNFQSADPFGAYEWAERVSIRGFNQNQLGFTLDGVPLGDASYGNVNGLHISRAAITDNLSSTKVSQGAGALGTQATNNLGGTIEFASMDPLDHYAFDVAGMGGSDNAYRAFARLNLAAENGLRGYVSVDHHDTEKWKGYGHQRQTLVNVKAILPVGKAEFSAYFDYSNRAEVDYQDMSLGMLNRLGYNWDNISNNWALAKQIAQIAANRGDTTAPNGSAVVTNPAAGTVYPNPIQTVDDAYYSGGGLRHDYLGYLGVKAPLGEIFTGELKGYYHSNDGRGLWWTPYVTSPNGSPIAERTTEYSIRRGGLFGDVKGEVAGNKITVGGWWEHNAFHQARRYYSTTLDNPNGLLDWPTNPFYTQWEYAFKTDTLQYYVEDSYKLADLTVNLGWKGFQVVNKSAPITAGSLASGRIAATDWFQPHAGATYKIDTASELFASFSQSTRAFTAAATGVSPFATTQAGFNAIAGSLKPENSDTYEVGYRYGDGMLRGTLGAYLVNFHNRLLGVSSGAGIVGSPTILQNVGDVRSAGVEALLSAKLPHHLNATVTYGYNDSTYRNDVTAPDGSIVHTAGKTTVDAPKHTARLELGYDDTVVFGRVAANYMSKRYFTYTNGLNTDSDGLGYVGGRAVFDMSCGYRWANSFTKKPLEVQVNVTNLFDAHYVSTIGTNGFGNVGDNPTMMVGSPRSIYASLKAGF